MGRWVVGVLALAAAHGGSCGNGCAHTGAHAGGAHLSSPTTGAGHTISSVSSKMAPSAHSIVPVRIQSNAGPMASSNGALVQTTPQLTTFNARTSASSSVALPHPALQPTTTGSSWVSDFADVAADIAMSLFQSLPDLLAPPALPELAAPPPPVLDDVPLSCHSFEDCGDGTLHQGVLCDRSASGSDFNAAGICRDACRDDHDCPKPFRCFFNLDPADATWGGCRKD